VYALREQSLRVVQLREHFHIPQLSVANTSEVGFLVVTQVGPSRLGILVDAVQDQRDIVVKTLGALAGENGLFAGAADTGDGSVALLVDLAALHQSCSDVAPAASTISQLRELS
jgi:two-component system, chemotaxis family, sensor kinase CheA